jgi:membrane protease YdiL (CAAX protease family)
MKTKPMPLWKNFMLHIVPGIIITAVYILLSSVIVSPAIPKALLFYVSALVLIPTAYIILKLGSPTGKAIDAIGNKEKPAFWKALVFGVLAFVLAGLVMTLLKQLNNYIQNQLFGWMNDQFAVSDYLIHPERYSKNILIITWITGLLTTSTIVPIVEELYFRGYLLKELDRYKLGVVFLSALFFSLYHVFSPWMLLSRFIALLPMTYFIWKYKDIRIGIIAHVLLNLVGDSLSSMPIIFGA